MLRVTVQYCCRQQGGGFMSIKSRAAYFKERRERYKQFSVAIEKDKLAKFEKILADKKQTKVDWTNEKIDAELLSNESKSGDKV